MQDRIGTSDLFDMLTPGNSKIDISLNLYASCNYYLVLTFWQVHIPLDPVSRQSKGLAYVTFVQPSSALSAHEALDKKSFQGRLLHILPAVDRKGKPEGLDGKLSIKADRKAKRKATAGGEFNWSMLYMNVRQANVLSCLLLCSLIYFVVLRVMLWSLRSRIVSIYPRQRF